MKRCLTKILAAALVACMLLCMLPAVFASTPVDYYLLIREGKLLAVKDGEGSLPDVTEQYASTFSLQADGTWLMNGLDFHTTSGHGIVAETFVTIVLAPGSTNTVECSGAETGTFIGLQYQNGMTIQGAGRLDVTAGNGASSMAITNSINSTLNLNIKGGAEVHAKSGNASTGISVGIRNDNATMCIENASVYAQTGSGQSTMAVQAARLEVIGSGETRAVLNAASGAASTKSSFGLTVAKNGTTSGMLARNADLLVTVGAAGMNSTALNSDSSIELDHATLSGNIGASGTTGSVIYTTGALRAVNQSVLRFAPTTAPTNSSGVIVSGGITFADSEFYLVTQRDTLQVNGSTDSLVTVQNCIGRLTSTASNAFYCSGALSAANSDLRFQAKSIGVYVNSLTISGGNTELIGDNIAVYSLLKPILTNADVLVPADGTFVKGTTSAGGSFYTVKSNDKPATSVTIAAPCAHVWNSGTVSTQATCASAGTIVYRCTICGKEKTEAIPPQPHTPVTDPAVAATCTTSGKSEGSHCSVCGAVITAQKTTLPLGHIDENKDGTCDRCGQPYTLVNPFADVTGGFYYDAVLWAFSQNVTAGTDATHFSPKASCTRGQVVTFLWRALGKPEPASTAAKFVDCTDTSKFYYKAVLWAAENDVTAGVDATHFAPNATVTRGQFVTFLWRALGRPEPMLAEARFVDCTNPAKFYYKAVLWAVENDVTAGVDATHFAPDNYCTRGQVVTFLYRGIK